MKIDLSRYDDLANHLGKAIAQKLVEQGLLQKIDRVVVQEVIAIRNKHEIINGIENKSIPPAPETNQTNNQRKLHWLHYALAFWLSAPLGFLIASRFDNQVNAITEAKPTTLTKVQTTQTEIKTRPLKIKLEIAEPTDLQIKEGQTVKAGQILADRVRERQRLELQKAGLVSSITKLEVPNIPPLEPSAAPQINKLPDIAFAEEEANIDAADITIADVQEKIRLQERKIDTLATLPADSVPPAIATHEQQVLAKLEKELERAKNNKQLAIARLKKAQDRRAYDEYTYTVDRAKDAHEQNQAKVNYERARSEYQKAEQERNVELANLQQKVNEVDNQLANLSIVRSPYDGTIKRLKFTGQNNNNLTVELLLAISKGTGTPGNKQAQSDNPYDRANKPGKAEQNYQSTGGANTQGTQDSSSPLRPFLSD